MCASLVVSLSLLVMSERTSLGLEAEIIKIEPDPPPSKGKMAGISLDPKTTQINRNAIAIWVNGLTGEEVQVIFEDGKTCKDVTANPQFFGLNARSCYVTSFIKPFGNASLQFPESGKFEYKVTTVDGKLESKGTIIVR